jgi:hypothetical protein
MTLTNKKVEEILERIVNDDKDGQRLEPTTLQMLADRMGRYAPYFKQIYDNFKKAGFEDEHAMRLTAVILDSIMKTPGVQFPSDEVKPQDYVR